MKFSILSNEGSNPIIYREKFRIIRIASRTRILLIFVGFLYLLILHFSYRYKICPEFVYMGYVYSNPPVYIIMIAWLTGLTPLLWMPVNITRPSQIIYWFLYLLVVIPVSIVPVYISRVGIDSLIKISWPILISFAFMGLFYKFPLLSVKRIHIPQILFWWISIVSIGFLYLFILRNFRSHLVMVNPLLSSEVYKTRLSGREILAQSSVISGYLIPTLSEKNNMGYDWFRGTNINVYDRRPKNDNIFSIFINWTIFHIKKKWEESWDENFYCIYFISNPGYING